MSISQLRAQDYNPDILNTLANLSNDEVFTPPEVANQVLDLLPQELFRDPGTTFLDPATKSGVFLREIARRLMTGLAEAIPDEQERRDHIFHHQLYGIAITQLTSLMSRRSLYCSKFPNGRYSVSRFDTSAGNIRFKKIEHRFDNGRCVYCGANESQYGISGREGLEFHAYEFIHTISPEEIFNMKFDVIIGNPPYQLETSDTSRQAKPIYNLFIEQAQKLKPMFLTMIIPSRWFAGGMGMDRFREMMMKDKRVIFLYDFANAKDCFPQNSISGGVCYFLWSKNNPGHCDFISNYGGKEYRMIRDLDEFPTLVRYNEAVYVIRKIQAQNEQVLSEIASSISPFGLPTSVRGNLISSGNNKVKLHSSAGISYISKNDYQKGHEWIGKYKVLVSQTGAEHAGEPAKDGKFKVLTSSLKAIGPYDVCTHSYLLIGPWTDESSAKNAASYLKTQFVRFLILAAMSSIHITKNTFLYVPLQDFSKPWTDAELYAKYGLTEEEIAFIESMIRPMGDEGDSDA